MVATSFDAVKPRFVMPVQGGLTHLSAHAITPVNGGVYELPTPASPATVG